MPCRCPEKTIMHSCACVCHRDLTEWAWEFQFSYTFTVFTNYSQLIGIFISFGSLFYVIYGHIYFVKCRLTEFLLSPSFLKVKGPWVKTWMKVMFVMQLQYSGNQQIREVLSNILGAFLIKRILHGRTGIRILSSSAESISHEWARLTRERYFQPYIQAIR